LTDFNYLVNNYADGDLDGFKPPTFILPLSWEGKIFYRLILQYQI